MRLLPIIAVAVLALLTVRPAPAQTPSAEAMAAARELVTASKAIDQFKAALPMVLQQIKPMIAQGRAAVEKDYDAVTPALLAASFERLNEMAEMFAQVYARNFSTAEMRDITAFYRTPTGQALIAKMPIVMQESMAAGQQFGQAVSVDLQKRVVEELRKRGHDIKL